MAMSALGMQRMAQMANTIVPKVLPSRRGAVTMMSGMCVSMFTARIMSSLCSSQYPGKMRGRHAFRNSRWDTTWV